MIITLQKDFKYLLPILDDGLVFIVGCSECATLCQTSGIDEVLGIKESLKKINISVSVLVLLEPACHLQNNRRLHRDHQNELNKATKVLAFCCGNGMQTIGEILDIVPGTDTLFLEEIQHATEFEEQCVLCGECTYDLFNCYCPVTSCPKSMLNSPCGCCKNEKCEVDSSLDCVWYLIYKGLKEKNKTAVLEEIQNPKD